MLPSAAVLSELRVMIRLAIPLVIGQVMLFGVNVVDTLLAGHMGPQVLGAVAIGSSLWMLPMMAMQGIMFAVPPSVAQLDGAGRRTDVGAVFRQALWLALPMGLLVLVAVRAGAALAVDLMAVTPAMAADVVAFLHAIAWGAPALVLFMACRGLSDGLSQTRPAMWFGLMNLVLLVPIGFVLMYGYEPLGIASMGARGSGLATAIVTWLGALAFLAYVAVAPGYRGIGWRTERRGPDVRAIGGLLKLGVPMAASVVLEVSLFSMAAIMIGRFGPVAMASHQIALNVAGLSFMIPLGLAGAITVRVGNHVGRGDPHAARLSGLLGMGLALATQALCATGMLLAPWAIAGLYTGDQAVLAGAVSLLGLAGLFQLSDGLQVVANGALRGIKDTRVPVVITLFAYWVIGMPVGLGLAFWAGMAARGMWIGLLAGLSVAAVLLAWRFHARAGRALRGCNRIGVPA